MPEPPKPIPYASAVGSRPPAPWATKDELDALSAAVGSMIDGNCEMANHTDNWRTHCEARLKSLEAFVAQDRQDWQHEVAKVQTAIEWASAPEPLAPGVRVWRVNRTQVCLSRGDSYCFCTEGVWSQDFPNSDNGGWPGGWQKLHGHERDEVIRDWMNRGNV